jgi:GNAT superfamily N-acetyltransferase
MMPINIRRAKVQDAKPLSECIEAAYSVYRSRISDLPSVTDGIAQTIESNRVWVAEAGKVIVGGIVLIAHEEFMMLENDAVHPDSSGMGVGAALIKQAELDCSTLGLTTMRLSTHVDMPENVRLYQHLGWHETGRSSNKIQMSKDI